ncbi:hypothetical protein EHS89_20465 [Amphritea balenae]|uniref:Uncharacterized protein n=1 Tax=Amphritea balenae TaxID=452629 RepID=A0A3P1SK88_9GAMM|nr:hypothetical protein [Amphritea balenae]RRC96732.1 hypothetical protein EHS89_20465 [Amphritea balenae]
MITNDEAYVLIRKVVGSEDKVSIYLDDFGPVCVANFGYVTPEATAVPVVAEPVSLVSQTSLEDMLSDEIEVADCFDIPIGLGPLLIDKRDSEIYETGSAVIFPSEYYVQSFLACGDPCGEATARIKVTNSLSTDLLRDTAVMIHRCSDVSISKALFGLRKMSKGDIFEFTANSPSQACQLAIQLRQAGLLAIQCWCSGGQESIDKMFSNDTVLTSERLHEFDQLLSSYQI